MASTRRDPYPESKVHIRGNQAPIIIRVVYGCCDIEKRWHLSLTTLAANATGETGQVLLELSNCLTPRY